MVANTINLFNFGLQRNLLNVWQLVVIPITSFGTLPTSVKGLKIIMTGGTVGQARQWDIDLISLTDNSVPSINEQVFNILKDGALVGQSSSLNFKGAPITVTNDPINKKIDVEFTGGDMLRSTYDPTNVNANAFDMENMIEGATKKILTSAERTKLNNLSGTNTGDQDLTPYLTSATAAATYQPIGSYLTSISGLNISQLANVRRRCISDCKDIVNGKFY